jgi:hypothetical protein
LAPIFTKNSDEEIRARNKCVSYLSKSPLFIAAGPEKK